MNFPGLNGLGVSGSVTGIIIPNQSGQFFDGAIITRLANPSANTRKYELILSFYNSGVYDSSWCCRSHYPARLW